MSFRPEGTKFLTLESGDVMTKATMCRECGFIEMTGDVEKLRRLTSETSTGGGQTAGSTAAIGCGFAVPLSRQAFNRSQAVGWTSPA
jgi:hypothetical protein